MKKTELFCYEDIFPDWQQWEQTERGEEEVLVKYIIGSSDLLKSNYYYDYSPKSIEINSRYLRLHSEISELISKGIKTIEIGSVHLYKFTQNSKTICYMVGSDGNRRVSNCKVLGAEKIIAEITEVKVPINIQFNVELIRELIGN